MEKLFCFAEKTSGRAKAERLAETPLDDSDMVLQRFYKHVEERGDDIYLTQPITGQEKASTYTFKQVYEEALAMSTHINSYGFEKNSKIAMVSKNCAHFFMAELAIWMSGNTTVALFPNLNASTAEYIFEHCEAKMLFVGKVEDSWNEMKKGVPEGIPKIGLPLAPSVDPPTAEGEYELWDTIVNKNKTVEGEKYPTRDFDDESLIVYTSGSTGKPKGVLHSFRTITKPAKIGFTSLSATKDDRVLSYLPLAHVMERYVFCASLYFGFQIFFAESLDTFLADLQRARPTLFLSVPRLYLKFQLGVFKKLPEQKLTTLLKIPIVSRLIGKKILTNLGLESARLAGCGSAPIPAPLLDWYRSIGLNILEGYGMSENFCFSHLTIEGKAKHGYIGSTYVSVDHKIDEENGEILVKSPGTMVGYYKAPDKTAEVMTEDGFLRTGDKGEIDSEGRLKITGRIKELFKTSKGKYVAPAPIENKLNANSFVELSLVGGVGQVTTMAVVQLAEGLLAEANGDALLKKKITDDLASLLKKVNGQIEAYEKVGFIAVTKKEWTIENQCLTPTMKIKRTEIEKLYESKLEKWYESKEKVIWE